VSLVVPEAPLSGVRVIDLTRVLAGPFCTMLLADLGADVIKIEPPEGDPVRAQSTGDLGGYFASVNRNKRSVVLDLYTPGGRDSLKDLITGADVLVENFRPGVLDKIGFSPATLEALRPDLVVCSINGFGAEGPLAQRPAFDFIAQAMSGFMSVTGTAETPMRAGPPIADLTSGLYGALAVVGALMHRARTNEGQRVETAMVNSLISLLGFYGVAALGSGTAPQRVGNDHFVVAPYGLFSAADGPIAVAPSNDAMLMRFLQATGLEGLLSDARFATNAARLANRAALNAAVDARMIQATRAQWVETLERAGVPCGEMLGVEEAMAAPQTLAQEMVIEVPTENGVARTVGFPMKFSRTPCRVRVGAPALGEHTREVLGALRPD
jgi:CoA:oxalate CoA-transferase